MKKIFLLSLLIIAGLSAESQIVLASNSTLSVSPASVNSAVGKAFNVSVRLTPADNQVCVVKGTLLFDNLVCRSITVSSGLMAQTTPTCASPSFVLGIPKCTTAIQNILSASVKGIKAGQGTLSFIGVKVIGAGADVAFSLQNGVYNITAAQAAAPESVKKITESTEPIVQQAVIPEQETVLEQEIVPENNIAETAGTASLASTGSKWFNYFIIALIILIVLCGIYYFSKKLLIFLKLWKNK